ncbi:MAG: penicillin-binding protein 2 [Victivallales bacterium]|nr:penicillin-binding protein 2 [Victivallales bacterium]
MRHLLTKSRNRIIIVGGMLLFAYVFLLAKLWMEQIHRGDSYREKISRQSIRRIRIPAPRGKILSSDLQVLAENLPSYDVYLYFEEMRQPGRRSETIRYIENAILQIDAVINSPSHISRLDIERHMNTRPGLPFKVADDIDSRQMAKLFELSAKVQGLGIIPRGKRIYPAGDIGAHVIGYTRPEDPSKASDRNEYFYYQSDLKGVCGIEKHFDTLPFSGQMIRGLKGYPGFSLVQVDHRGFVYKTLIDEIKPLNGNNIVLTLNWRAQKIAAELMRGQCGTLVLLDADTGAVLAMVSRPAFDLQAFSPRISSKAYRELVNSPDKPLFCRAALGEYMPGSIVKPLVALALLKKGVKADETVDCDGETQIGNARIRCSSWRKGGHGEVDMRHAIEKSCNDYFIEKGKNLQMEDLRHIFASAGFGSRTGVDLPERCGRLPAREDKKRTTGFAWNQYDTALLCIGQGYITVTPLQIAVYAAALANGGTLYQPRLLKEIRNSAGTVLYRSSPLVKAKLDAGPEELKIIRAGMRRVVAASGGSGRLAANPVIALSGKTGTAELTVNGRRRQNTWFIAYGSYKNKNYAVAILIENGVSGGLTCAPLAKNFFMKFLK